MEGPAGLRAALLKHQDMFQMAFTENLLTYALGRRIAYTDMPLIRQITRDAAKKDNKLSAYVMGVVNSPASRWAWPTRPITSGARPTRRRRSSDNYLPGIRDQDSRSKHVSHSEASLTPHDPQGRRGDHGAAVPRGDDSRPRLGAGREGQGSPGGD
jgi:hypothetical protein